MRQVMRDGTLNSMSHAIYFFYKKETFCAQVERLKCLANDRAADLRSRQDLFEQKIIINWDGLPADRLV